MPPLPDEKDLALIRHRDGGHRVWKRVEVPWTEAGVPLEVVYVPGGRHEWLLRGEQKATFRTWLGKLD
jgi:hypothetical protein